MGFREYLRGDNALTFEDMMERVRMMVWTKYASDGYMNTLATQLQEAGSLTLLEFKSGMIIKLEGDIISTKQLKTKDKLIINLELYVYTQT